MSDEWDAAIEAAAQRIEASDFRELQGVWAKRKRDREDAELRGNTIRETRALCAEEIRQLKRDRRRDATAVLREIALLKNDDIDHVCRLHDAWPLAWKGWVAIEHRVICSSSQIGPPSSYHIHLTERGRAKLQELGHASDCAVNNGPAMEPGRCDCGADP